ncbi:MAG: rhodanese-like domain-containing protein [Halioglobus sp.]
MSIAQLSGCAGLATPTAQARLDRCVRTQQEFDAGHLDAALHIPYDAIESGIAPLSLDPDTLINLYCGSGRRAGLAKERLEALGFTQVTNAGSLESARRLLRTERAQRVSDL